jgi:hypothetical protein
MAQLRLPRLRGVAVALLFLLMVTAVHGAASVAVPAVAIAGGPASIGAALLHHTLTPSGRNGSDDGAMEHERQAADDQPCTAGSDRPDPQVPAALTDWSAGSAVGVLTVQRSHNDSPVRRHISTSGSRAPPPGVPVASSILG